MNYFDNINITDKIITVLGVSSNSDFVMSLRTFLAENGREDVSVITPDSNGFKTHKNQELDGQIFGVLSVNIFEKRICDVLKQTDDFCKLNDLEEDELIFPKSVANVVLNEKYDVLFIDDVDSPDKRFLARETAKILREGVDVYMINTDSQFIETFVKHR